MAAQNWFAASNKMSARTNHIQNLYVMKTNSLRSILFAGAALAAAAFALADARAGADPGHARNQHKAHNTPALTTAERPPLGCTDARLVTVTETK